MAEARTDPLNVLLEEQLRDRPEELERVRELLAPFYKIVAKGEPHPFARETELDAKVVAKAIRLAIGRKVKRVIFVSSSHPFPKPEWMTQEEYGASLGASLEDSLEASLRDSLRGSLWASLFYFLGFTITKKSDEAKRLEPLVRLLPQCIPLGEKKDEPGVWLVVCK